MDKVEEWNEEEWGGVQIYGVHVDLHHNRTVWWSRIPARNSKVEALNHHGRTTSGQRNSVSLWKKTKFWWHWIMNLTALRDPVVIAVVLVAFAAKPKIHKQRYKNRETPWSGPHGDGSHAHNAPRRIAHVFAEIFKSCSSQITWQRLERWKGDEGMGFEVMSVSATQRQWFTTFPMREDVTVVSGGCNTSDWDRKL